MLNGLYSIYGTDTKNTKHILRDCPWFSRFWFLFPLDLVVDSFIGKDFTCWMEYDILPKGAVRVERAFMLASSIRNSRHKLIFEEIPLDALATVKTTLSLYHAHTDKKIIITHA